MGAVFVMLALLWGGAASAQEPAPDGAGAWTPSVEDYRAAQTELKRLRLFSGAADGVWEVLALFTLRDFQHAHGLSPADGALTEATLAALRAEPTPAPELFHECAVCPEMVVVPAGSFLMGSPEDEPERREDEGPPHDVFLPRFAIGRTEITVGEFRRFVEATGWPAAASCWTFEKGEWAERQGRDWTKPGYKQNDKHPVACVSRRDAETYVTWLNTQVEGEPYRLPSEAEWEYAARAGTATPFWTGASIDAKQANFNAEAIYNGSKKGGFRRRTVEAGSLPANPWGLHETQGNVMEWVRDCWNTGYWGAPADGGAWMTGDCEKAVARGGSWGDIPKHLRAAERRVAGAAERGFHAGFRVARRAP